MKRIIIPLLFILFVSSLQSQSYMIKIEGYVGSGKSDCGSQNGMKKVTLLYENGNEKIIHDIPYFRNKSYQFEDIFLESNRVIKIKFKSHTRKKNAFRDCKGGEEIDKIVSVPSSCSKYFFKREEIYHSKIEPGYAKVSIHPILEPLKFKNSIEKETAICESKSIEIKATQGFPSSVYKWQFLDVVNKETVDSEYYKSLLEKEKKLEKDFKDCLDENARDCTKILHELMSVRGDLVNTPKTEEVSVWRNLTDLHGSSTLNLKLSDLYSSESDQNKVFNKKIRIRLKPDCITEQEANQKAVTIQFKPEMPEILPVGENNEYVEYIPIKCHDDKLTEFAIYFGRNLGDAESVGLTLYKKHEVSNEYNVFIDQKIIKKDSLSRIEENGKIKYKFIWNNNTSSGFEQQSYKLEVFGDKKGLKYCRDTTKYNLKFEIPKPVKFTIKDKKDQQCYKNEDGQIKINVEGGTNKYKYSIDNGVSWNDIPQKTTDTTTFIIEKLLPKEYTVLVIDSNDCMGECTNSNIVTINPATQITHTVEDFTPPGAHDLNDAAISIKNVTGGTVNDTYSYSVLLNGNDTNTITGTINSNSSIATTISGLPAGNHIIKYTDDNGCEQQYDLPNLINPDSITVDVNVINSDCYNKLGIIDLKNIKGGYPNYTIELEKEGAIYKSLSDIDSDTIIEAEKGTYSLKIKDRRLGVFTKTVAVDVPEELIVEKIEHSPILCYGYKSNVKITAKGGSGEYQYAIYKRNTIYWQNSNTFYLKARAGGYRFIVRDKNELSCNSKASGTLTLNEPNGIFINVLEVVHNEQYFDEENGKISISVSGGKPNYQVKWYKIGDSSFRKTSYSIEGLKAGDYKVIISDANNCQMSKTVTINQPPKLVGNISIVNPILCKDGVGNLKIVAQGGVGSYAYQWYKDSTIIQGATTNILQNVTKGNYSVEISDDFISTKTNKTLTEPNIVKFSLTKTDVTCYHKKDGSITISPLGGSGTYFYSIDEKRTYVPLQNATIFDLDKGSYTIWVKDSNECEAESSETVEIDEPEEIKILNPVIKHNDIAGESKGSITIDVSGISGTPTYLWTKNNDNSFVKTTKDIDQLSTGIYTVKIKDITGCEVIKSYEVKEPLPIQVSLKIQQEIVCKGDSSGKLLATVTGGYPIESTPSDFNYKWYLINEDNTESLISENIGQDIIRNLKSGIYKVVVNDSKGETAESKIEITEPPLLTALLNSTTNIKCFGDSTGKIEVVVSGGTPPYEYKWSKAGDSNFTVSKKDLEGITAGTYTLKVEDSKQCNILVEDIVIKEPLKPLTIENAKVENLKGFETNDGSISISVLGGTPNYTYQWRVKGTTEIISENSQIDHLKVGEYEVTVLDENQCFVIKSYRITQPDLLEIVTITQKGTILCYGDKNSSLNTNVRGGVKPYTYGWYKNDSLISGKEVLENIGAGLYTLKIIDANKIKITDSYEIKQPEILNITITDQKHVTCYNGNNGEISIQVNGGTPPYTYIWASGETKSHIENLKSGIYQVTVRDKNLCELSKEIIIKQPENPITIEKYNVNNVTGYGLANGSIEVFVKGGTPSYTYEWSNSENQILASSTNKITSLVSGDYKLTITDSKGCILKDLDFTVSQPPVLEATIKTDSIACFGGRGNLTAIAKGGVPSYKYRWYKFKENTVIGNVSRLEDIKGGIYDVEIEDANGNLAKYDSIVLSEPDLLKIDDIQIKNVTCYEGNDGKILINVSGGVQPYTYIWNSGTSKNELNNIRAGQYAVTILDKKGCSITKDSILVKEPSIYDISKVSLVRPSGKNTQDGSIKVTIVGGTEPYHYIWKDDNETVISEAQQQSATTSELLSLNEGKYSLSITDAKGCQILRTYNLANPGELLVSIEQLEKIRCNGGNDAVLDVITTGTGGNSYMWYDAKDNSIIGNRKILKNVSKGSYYVVVSNAFGMEEQSSAFEVIEPTPVQLQSKINNVSCYEANDGSITLNATGGNGTYEYRYRLFGDSYSNWKIFSNGTKETINNLPKGNYGIQIRDTDNCFYTANGMIKELVVTIKQPKELQIINESILYPSGFGLSNGSIQIETTGGTLPYTYEWLNSKGDKLSNSNKISNIKKGDYSVKITDGNNCIKEKIYKITQPEKLEVAIFSTEVISCNGMSNGSLRVEVQGGNADLYKYNWYKKGIEERIGTETVLNNLDKGIYYVEVEDANGNKAKSLEYNLIEPSELQMNLVPDYQSCGKGNDWSIKAEVSGGTPPYTYLWNNGNSSANLTDVEIGTYKVTVADARGCKIESEISLSEPKSITITEQVEKPTCYKGNDGKIKLNITGGTPPYFYEWDNGESTNEILGTPGIYKVVVKDSKGCYSPSKSIEIPNTEPIKVDLGEDVTLCNGQTYILDGRIENGVSYKWTSTNGFTSADDLVEISEEGTYTVVATNKFGCEATDEILISKVDGDVSAEFIVSSQVFSDESFVIINVSNPKPDQVVWITPKEAKIIEKNDNYCEVKIEKEGEYEITLATTKNKCEKFQTKKVVVLDREITETDDENDYKKPMIQSFVIYPNPSSGNFTIDVTLREEKPIDIKIFNLSSSAMLSHKKYQNKKEYKATYDMSLPTNVYFVVLETVGTKQVKKIIIK